MEKTGDKEKERTHKEARRETTRDINYFKT